MSDERIAFVFMALFAVLLTLFLVWQTGGFASAATFEEPPSVEVIEEVDDPAPGLARGDGRTVREIARRGVCSTAGIQGLSRQLAETQSCMGGRGFENFVPHPRITLSASRLHPYLQSSAKAALHEAAETTPLTINSAFRTLADQYVLFHSGACGLAAPPGRSNHQSGRAVDVRNWRQARRALQAAGCDWFGRSDAVHFDCPGEDRRDDAVRAFQVLWNANNPDDTIPEDGQYGPQTGTRLARTPAAGFPRGGCR